jgi:hypothetical protein
MDGIVTAPPHKNIGLPLDRIQSQLQSKPAALCGDGLCAADEYCCNDSCSKQPCQ